METALVALRRGGDRRAMSGVVGKGWRKRGIDGRRRGLRREEGREREERCLRPVMVWEGDASRNISFRMVVVVVCRRGENFVTKDGCIEGLPVVCHHLGGS